MRGGEGRQSLTEDPPLTAFAVTAETAYLYVQPQSNPRDGHVEEDTRIVTVYRVCSCFTEWTPSGFGFRMEGQSEAIVLQDNAVNVQADQVRKNSFDFHGCFRERTGHYNSRRNRPISCSSQSLHQK